MVISCYRQLCLRIGPYLFYIQKFTTQFKTTEKNDDLPHPRGPVVKKKPPFSNARGLKTRKIVRSGDAQCNTRKTWFKSAVGLTLTQSTTLLMKAKFSYCDQIKLNEPVLKPGTPE